MMISPFGPESEWPRSDLIGWSHEFSSDLVELALQHGLFPMPLAAGPDADDPMGWWSPVRRGVVPITGLRISRSLRKSGRRLTTTVDRDFAQVIDRCADPSRPGAWIDGRIRAVFTELHEAGHAHSIEVWDSENRLVGGLYGWAMGGFFSGESMFHDPAHGRDASKVALIRLVELLREGAVPPSGDRLGNRLLDVQWLTDHLASLGAVEISRESYLQRMRAAQADPGPSWPTADAAPRRVPSSAIDTTHTTHTAREGGGRDA